MTAIAALLLALVPGVLLCLAVPPGRERWVALSAAPALSLGLTAAGTSWLPALGLPDGAVAVLVAEFAIVGLTLSAARWGPRLVERVRRRGSGVDDAAQPAVDDAAAPDASPADRVPTGRGWYRRILAVRADVLGVAIPSMVAVGVGWLILGRLLVPPGWDAMNHGFLTRRILDAGSVATTKVCTTGATDAVPSCSFYPLAENVQWAQAVQLSGGRISAAMTAWMILIGPLALVIGSYAFVRHLGGRPIVAACAALAPAIIGPIWTSMITGRVNQQTAPCLVAATALLIALALRGDRPVRTGALAALACSGILLAHTYDLMFVAIVALVTAFVIRGPRHLGRAATGAATIAVCAAVTVAPSIGALLGASSERPQEPPALPDMWAASFRYWVTDTRRYILYGYPTPGSEHADVSAPSIQIALWLTIVCLIAAPLSLVLRELRWARPWLVAGVVFTALGIWTSSSTWSSASAVSGLWYNVPERLHDMIFPVYGILAAAGAVAIALVLSRLVRVAIRRTHATLEFAPAAFVAIFMVGTVVLGAVPSSWHAARTVEKRYAPGGRSYVATFRWLDQHTPPGKLVAYDRHSQFMTWSYADYGTPLLFGIPPLVAGSRTNFDQRRKAWDWLVDNDNGVPEGGCEVRRLGVEYVVIGGRHVPGTTLHYTPALVEGSPRLTLVQQFGSIRIYQVNDAGRACSTRQPG